MVDFGPFPILEHIPFCVGCRCPTFELATIPGDTADPPRVLLHGRCNDFLAIGDRSDLLRVASLILPVMQNDQMFVIGWAVGGVWIADDFETAWYCAQRGVQAFHATGAESTYDRPALFVLDVWGRPNERGDVPEPAETILWGDSGPPPAVELVYPKPATVPADNSYSCGAEVSPLEPIARLRVTPTEPAPNVVVYVAGGVAFRDSLGRWYSIVGSNCARELAWVPSWFSYLLPQ